MFALAIAAPAQPASPSGSPPAPPAFAWEEIKAKWSALPLAHVQITAEQGDPAAQIYLGSFHFEGLGGTTNQVEGLKWYRKAAEQGVAEAQRRLATALLTGTVTPDRRNEAREWLEKAARSGNAGAQIQLAHFLGGRSRSGVLEPRNALYWYKKAFAQGRTNVCSNIGWLYAHGYLGERDPEEAIHWFQKGAETGDSYCELAMGLMHVRGEGVEQSLEEAKKWMRRAVEKGNLSAHFELAQVYELRDVFTSGNVRPDYATAAALYRKGAEAGEIRCGLRLAQLYYEHRAEAQPAEALGWVRRAADQDREDGLLFLADLYAKGVAEPRHPRETTVQIHWKLARMMYASGFMALAHGYRAGEGVPKDLILAAFLSTEAANRIRYPEPDALKAFAVLDEEGRPRPQTDKAAADFAQELALFLRVLDKKEQQARLEIARRYLTGEGGLPRSEFEACIWFSFAAAQGAPGAGEQATTLRGQLTEAQLSDANWRVNRLVYHQEVMKTYRTLGHWLKSVLQDRWRPVDSGHSGPWREDARPQ